MMNSQPTRDLGNSGSANVAFPNVDFPNNIGSSNINSSNINSSNVDPGNNSPRPNAGLHDFPRLLAENIPLIDVRSPMEFQQATLPGAINLPLMTDDERARVGTCYKQQGRQAALALGHQLVCGALREQRLNAWREACTRYPQGYLFCARGGLRSHLAQRWLQESGIAYPLVTGGYKALRRAAIQAINELAQRPLVLIGGCTGSGKTALIQSQPYGVDLEALARHRGSSFGRTALPQPRQASFENALAATLLTIARRHPNAHWVLEDEGRAIGTIHLPEALRERMSRAPILVVEDPFEQRLARLRQEYFILALADFQTHYGDENGWQRYADWLRHGMFSIRRRLGLERYQQYSTSLEQALTIQQSRHSTDAHLDWLIPLLIHYYDPMYRYQLEKKAHNIVFRGNYQQVLNRLNRHDFLNMNC